jgi:toxin FitB
MYLIDTDVLSEIRKGSRADAGVRAFFREEGRAGAAFHLSVVTIGEIRRGVALIQQRGDEIQARRLEKWLDSVLAEFQSRILPFDVDCAQTWGQLRVPQAENPLDKQIAATALVHGLTVVTGNLAHFRSTGVPLRDPYTARGLQGGTDGNRRER